LSFSIFRQTDKFDISSFQTTNLGYLVDFSAHTMVGVDVSFMNISKKPCCFNVFPLFLVDALAAV